MGLQEHADNKYVKYVAGGIVAVATAYGLYKLYILFKPSSKEDDYFNNVDREGGKDKRVLVVGLDGAGKTQLVRCFRNLNTSPGVLQPRPQPTLGFNVLSSNIGIYSLNIWDVGGRIDYRPFWSDFLNYHSVDVIVWVVDSANLQRFQEARHALHNFLDNPAVDRLPVIIVAAKQDLSNSAAPDEVYGEMMVEQFRYNHNFYFVSSFVTILDERRGVWRLYKLICNAKESSLNVQLLLRNKTARQQ